jgi:hypothetical protein
MDKYYCDICIKNYASYQSLWNHTKKFHSTVNKNNNILNPNSNILNPNSNIFNPTFNKKDFNKLQCYYCNKFFKHASNKSCHIKTCKEKHKNIQIIENNNYKCDICNKEFANKNSIYKHKKKCKESNEILNTITHVTNNINNITNINNINNTNINNTNITNTTNVIKILNFSNAQFCPTNILSKKDRKVIEKAFDIYQIVDIITKRIYMNKDYRQMNNVFFPNLNNKYGHVFEDDKFIILDKNQIMDSILCSNNNILYDLNNESKNNNIQYFRNKLDDLNKSEEKNIKEEKIELYEFLKRLIYNNNDINYFKELKQNKLETLEMTELRNLLKKQLI